MDADNTNTSALYQSCTCQGLKGWTPTWLRPLQIDVFIHVVPFALAGIENANRQI